MLRKLTDQELEGYIDLYKNLVPKTKQQIFQSHLIATIVEMQKENSPKYKEALQKIVEKYSSKSGAAKIAKEALE